MSDPTTVNKTAGIVNAVLKKIIEGAGQDAVEAAIITAYPFMDWPFLKQILRLIISKVSGVIYQNAALAATAIIIDVQINKEKSDVLNSFEVLQMAVASGDAKAIAIASNDLDTSYGNIIHFDGSASP